MTLLDPTISTESPDPLWRQVAGRLAVQIQDGSLRSGSRLPPERELCTTFGISRVTLRKALGALVEEGVLQSSHGRGWYVGGQSAGEWPNSLESFSETAGRLGLIATSIVLRSAVSPATLDEAELLHMAPGAPLFRLDRVRMLGGLPIAVDRSLVPSHLAPGIEAVDFASASLYEHLVSAGLDLARTDTSIEATPADEDEAELLDIEPGRPILSMSQVVVDATGAPVTSSVIRYHGERYRLRTQFARLAPR